MFDCDPVLAENGKMNNNSLYKTQSYVLFSQAEVNLKKDRVYLSTGDKCDRV